MSKLNREVYAEEETPLLDPTAASAPLESNLDFDLDKAIKDHYDEQNTGREFKKVLFSIATCGFGMLYLWLSTKTVKEGNLSVRVDRDGRAIILPPGRHSNFPGESYGSEQSINQELIRLGPRAIVTIRDGYRGESYLNGKLVILFPGRHLLGPTHVFVKSVSMDMDEIDLGPKKIVTIKNGQVGIAYKKGVLNVLREGRHELNLPDDRFARVMSLQQEVVELPELNVKTTDNIQVTCHAILNYRIVDPVKAVTGVENLENSLQELAEVTLSSILRRMSFTEISPMPNNTSGESTETKGKFKAKHMNETHLRIHEDFTRDFETVVADWGIEIIGGVQLKTIQPRDAALRDAIAQMAINTARSDALRQQSAFDREVQTTKALTQKDSAILLAEADRQSKLIAAEAEKQATILKAEGEAESIRIISEARKKATENEGKAAEALTTSIAQQLAILGRQAEVLSQSQTPIIIPSEGLGKVNVWSRAPESNTMTHFTNAESGDGNTALISQIIAQQALRGNQQ